MPDILIDCAIITQKSRLAMKFESVTVQVAIANNRASGVFTNVWQDQIINQPDMVGGYR